MICTKCGYDMLGLKTNKCPKCGTILEIKILNYDKRKIIFILSIVLLSFRAWDLVPMFVNAAWSNTFNPSFGSTFFFGLAGTAGLGIFIATLAKENKIAPWFGIFSCTIIILADILNLTSLFLTGFLLLLAVSLTLLAAITLIFIIIYKSEIV